MGVDVEMKLRFRTPISDEQISDLDRRFRETFGVEYEFSDAAYPYLERDDYDQDAPNVVSLRTLRRFYGPGYERGHWPAIREWGCWLAVTCGETAELRYGNDCNTDWEALIPWADTLAENDPWWTEHGNEPYRAAFR